MMPAFRRTSIIAIAAVLSALMALPVAGDTGRRTPQVGDLVAPAEELVIGRQLSGAVAQQFPLVEDPFIDRYINHRGRQAAEVSSRSQIPYFFHVVGQSQINAFAIPGGYVYLNVGIIQVAETEAEMMAIVAHEIAHVASRHWAEQYTRQQLVGIAARIGLGAYPNQYAYMAANLFGELGFLKWSRDDERQADRLGYQIMMDAGYHPEGMLGIFEELVERQREEPGDVETLFQTHPGAEERLADIRRMLDENPPSDDLIRDTEQFQRIKRRVEEEFPDLPPVDEGEGESDEGEPAPPSDRGEARNGEAQNGEGPEGEGPAVEGRSPRGEDQAGEEQDEEADRQLPEVPERQPSGRWVHLGREDWRLEEVASRLDDRETAGATAAAAALRGGDMDAARSALDRLLESDAGDPVARYGRALARMRDTDGLELETVRTDLAVVLREEPLYRGAFRLWLALNPREEEIESVDANLERAAGGADSAANLARLAAHRADLAIWQEEPQEALDRLDEAALPPGTRTDRERARSWNLARLRALFEADRDLEGQRLYFALVESGDPLLLERLYRDLQPATTRDERQEIRDLATFDSTRAEAIDDPDEVADWFRTFWEEQDPLPADELNPRIGEHYRRLARAREEHGLQSNGDGYFVDWERFQELSPQLPHFPTSMVFDDQQALGYWIDHRGLWLLRHGQPDAEIGSRELRRMDIELPALEASDSATWVFAAGLPRTLAVHLVERNVVDEWIQVLNLGVAATEFTGTPDAPEQLSGDLTDAARDLYLSRQSLDRLFAQIARAGTRARLEELLRRESRAMAGFSKAGRRLTSTDFYDRDNTLPLTLTLLDRKAGPGEATVDVELAVETGSIEWGGTGEDPAFDVTLLLYDRDWQEVLREVEHSYQVDPARIGSRPGSDGDDEDAGVFFAAFEVSPVEPGTYHYAVQVTERSSGRVGAVKGLHAVDYFRDDWAGLSDLALRIRPSGSGPVQEPPAEPGPSARPGQRTGGAAGQQLVPSPARVIPEGGTGLVAYEIYNLGDGQQGEVSYQLKDYILLLQEEQGLGEQLLRIGQQVGYGLFPLYGFVAQLGIFAFDFLTEEEASRLDVDTRTLTAGAGGTVAQTYRIVPDERDLDPGIYELYLTVTDRSTGDVVTKSMTFEIAENDD